MRLHPRPHCPARPIVAAMIVISVPAGLVSAADWMQETHLLSSNGWTSDFYGTSVDLHGNVSIVGAPGRDDRGFEAGAAYVHRRAGFAWSEEAQLLADDGEAGDTFGSAVAIHGDLAVVGAPDDDDNGGDAGAVYVFRHADGLWTQEFKLLAGDGEDDDAFGTSVAIDGDVVIVGAPGEDDVAVAAGAVYVFRYDPVGLTWNEEQKLDASDGATSDEFGIGVAIDDDVIAVGAHRADGNMGAAYAFRYDPVGLTWSEEEKLVASDAAPLDEYGFAVAVSGDAIVVGARLDDDDGSFSGSAYVYRHDGVDWTEEQKLTASDAATTDFFGSAVDIDDDLIVVGAWGAPAGAATGAAYLFQRDGGSGWSEVTSITAGDGSTGDRLGESVAIGGGGVLVGAGRDDKGVLLDAGSAYLYRFALVGTAAGDRLAWSLADAGDVDDDGVHDLLIGSPFNDDRGGDAGRVDVYSGRTLDLLYTLRGQRAGDRFGWAVAGAGDVNRDGHADVVIGAPRYRDRTGRVYVHSGADGSRLHRFTGEEAGDQFGYAVAGGVDVDDDRRDDVIVGAPKNDDAGSGAGKAYVYSGRRGDLLGAVTGAAKGDRFGWSVAMLPRANGDDHGDFVVGSPKNDDRRKNAGRVDVFSGRNFRRLHTLTGRRKQDQFGACVARVGRADGDGRDDFAVGAPFYDAGSRANAGRIEVFSGRDGTRLYARSGQSADDRLGLCVRGAGDVDDDGHDDVIAGASRHDTAAANAGRMYVYSGVDGTTLTLLDGGAAGDLLGFAVAGLDDVDGDGRSDLLVGAPYEDTGGATAGRAYVLRSADGPAAPTGDVAAMVDASDDWSGARPEAPGDVDGDGAIDEADLVHVLAAWGAGDGLADLDHDGRVDESDLRAFIDAW